MFGGRRKKNRRTSKEGFINTALLKEAAAFVLTAAAAAVLSVLLVLAFGKSKIMEGDSMYPTIESGQRVFINRLEYQFDKPRKDDIVVFYSSSNKAHTYIKRIVAASGDRVLISDGFLYVNSELVEDGFDSMEEAGIADEEITLGIGEYFVLGDNRNKSEDSRNTTIGIVLEDNIIGKVWNIGKRTEKEQ